MAKKITDDELIARVDSELRQAQDYMGGKLAIQRQRALKYYMAQAEGDLAPPEIDGRSSFVSTDVADTVEWMLPTLLKIFTASDRVVQLNPRKPGMEQTAEDATDYLNWVFSVQNDGFRCLYTMFKDALISKTGILKVWWEDKVEEGKEDYTGLSDQELAQLLDDEEVEPINHTAKPDEEDAAKRQQAIQKLTQQAQQAQQAAQQGNPQAQQSLQQIAQQLQSIQAAPPVMLHDVTVKRVRNNPQCRIEPVPPEEFFISRTAKTIKDSPFCAHVREWIVSDLRAEGYDIKDDELPSDDAGMVGRSIERAQRWSYDDSSAPYPNLIDPPSDPSMRKVWVVEATFRADVDGDGIAEWRRLLKCGDKILENVECDGHPFVSVTPIPMPHRFFGLSIADLAMETQRHKTAAIRSILDNLYLQVNGRYFAVEGQVNLDDLLTSRPGGVVRVKEPGMVGPLNQGMADMRDAYSLLECMEDAKENRTGFTRYSQGSDSESLNKTATGVSIITNRSDMRLELVARVFAETGVRELFIQLLELICKYQRQPAEFRINGRWLNIDPREWRHQFDVLVNVGLGTNDTQQKIGQISQLMAVQQQLAEAGTGIVSPVEAYHSAEEMAKALGYKDPDRFFRNPENNPPPQPPPPPPDPRIEVEHAKLQATQQSEQARQQTDLQKFQMQLQADDHHFAQKLQSDERLKMIALQHEKELALLKIEADTRAKTMEIETAHQLKTIDVESANQLKAMDIMSKREELAHRGEIEHSKMAQSQQQFQHQESEEA